MHLRALSMLTQINHAELEGVCLARRKEVSASLQWHNIEHAIWNPAVALQEKIKKIPDHIDWALAVALQ
eukprot:1148392-Pelagomonas_calceolata.AAC.10